MSKIRRHGRGYVFTPKDFIHLGSRQAIDTALSRLTTDGDIRRLSWGLYDYPKTHHLLGMLYPPLDDVAKVIAKDAGCEMQISGARALYLMGLTTQVPAQTIYLTNAQSKKIRIGKIVLIFKHASPSVMAGAGSKVGVVLQVIRYLGKDRINDNVFDTLSRQMNAKDKQSLKKIARYAPGWSLPVIDKLLAA